MRSSTRGDEGPQVLTNPFRLRSYREEMRLGRRYTVYPGSTGDEGLRIYGVEVIKRIINRGGVFDDQPAEAEGAIQSQDEKGNAERESSKHIV